MTSISARAGFCLLAIFTSAAAPAPTAHRFRIVIQDLAFGAAPAGIRVGDTVEWDNQDILVHSVTAQDQSFDADVKPGAKVSFTMHRAGVIRYLCKYHPGMQGILNVGE
ncbi:MAG: cupredoxin domain-containing protein [Alphaproteobacteria bacterium]|nr:cupredoxin domain-containing protein [Alphaproteobacteria bacterium]